MQNPPSPEGRPQAGPDRLQRLAPAASLALALTALAGVEPGHAGEPAIAAPRAACLAAARRAEAVHGLPEGLMVAIALSESGLHAHALNIGGRAHFPDRPDVARQLLANAPARAAVMAGCVQVNARVHARGRDWPLDPVRAADWAGALLRDFHAATGDWTAALRRWHGGSPSGSQRVVCRVRAKLAVVAPGTDALNGTGCADARMARVRRNGVMLLEVAEAGDR